MNTFMLLLGAFFVTGLIACVIYSIRNEFVLKERSKVLDFIEDLNTKDIKSGKGYTGWRYEEFNRTSYKSMVWPFWRPISSFYKKDARCIDPDAAGPEN